ncbi:putative ABC transporter permease protein YurM [Paenibacillus nuruki]|uniref:Putative ABC transporter permease protein YurM n=1 Tax=Paenibacillus nuruki TaxID=1886670 RepID=A0A1E3L3W0_9BACL|nr:MULTISPECIES: carbohydrate ABC transporter permease [Paenibacillus]ODP28271.1 putative ABC transporter permease protein YurM [Paenibacillus nuruki]TKJ91088.1 carbohydrate ABC transporter permease [Paenibacillus sp. CFBP13512]
MGRVQPYISPQIHHKKRLSPRQIIIFIILALGSVLFLLPLWWMIATSLKSMQEIAQYPPTFIPQEFHLDNYIRTWAAAPFTQYTLNTLLLSFFAVTGNVIVNAFVAYGFARIRFRGKKIWFSILLATMMIPGFVTLIPQYVMFSKLHLVGTYYPLIIPQFLGSAFYIFMLRQFYLSIPRELSEAAKIDGASHFYTWLRVIIPLSKPALATIAILSFNGAWNDFLGPLLYVNDESLYTLQIGLQSFRGSVQTQWNYLMAGSVLVLLPVIVLFFIFQRYFIEGMNLTAGTKG